jgi:hypothetical protein
VTAANASRLVDTANPEFSAAYGGFVNGETAAVLIGSPAFSTTATASSPAGLYPITVSLGTLGAANYSFNFVSGALSVLEPPAVVITATATVGLYSFIEETGTGPEIYTAYQAIVRLTNTGTETAKNVKLTTAELGDFTPIAAPGFNGLPVTVGDLGANGGSLVVAIPFTRNPASDDTAVAEKYAGTYNGGTFSANVRAVMLP